jgi:hypothetical protein
MIPGKNSETPRKPFAVVTPPAMVPRAHADDPHQRTDTHERYESDEDRRMDSVGSCGVTFGTVIVVSAVFVFHFPLYRGYRLRVPPILYAFQG